MSALINHEELALSRLAVQFKDATKLIEYIKAMIAQADDLENAFQEILSDRELLNAVGEQLDVIGVIVGQPRELLNASVIQYFGFASHGAAQSFGTVLDPLAGGRWRGIGEQVEGSRSLTDEEYRRFILARIAKNIIIPTLSNLPLFFDILFETTTTLISESPMAYTISIGVPLDVNDFYFLDTADIVPKVAGVAATYVEYTP